MTEELQNSQNIELTPSDIGSLYRTIVWAMLNSRHRVAYFLLQRTNLNINTPDQRGETLLFYVAREGLDEQVDYLIENGADRSVKNENSHTAADIAFHRGHIDIQKKLKSYNNNPDSVS